MNNILSSGELISTSYEVGGDVTALWDAAWGSVALI